MIHLMPYGNIQNNLTYKVTDMNLTINFTYFQNEFLNVENTSGEITIPFEAHTKYDKNISIHLTKTGKLVIDELLADPFYYESTVDGSVDKICWFSIPVNYTGVLSDLTIYAKGGVNDGM